MTNCPYCDAPNIEGVDTCEECGHSLSDLHLAAPGTPVEAALLKDRLHVLEPNPPISVSPDTPVREALQTLVEKGIGCVLVTQDDQIVGIFSERDVLRKLNTRTAELSDQPVSQFMTASPQTLDTEAKVAFAVQRMDLGSYRHVPIVDGANHPTGVISARDILRYLTEKMTAPQADGDS